MLAINETISPDDHMLSAGNRDAYFRTARSGLECILTGLQAASRGPHDIRSVLDFGCGYGRVYRAIAAGFPHAKLTACDLMETAAQFCAETFGGDWVKSSEDLAAIVLPRKYDLVWLGSVFTHLPAHRWLTLLEFLATAADKNGVVIFTTHGVRAIERIESFIMKQNPYMIDADRYKMMKRALPTIGFDFIPSKAAIIKHQNNMGIDVSLGEYGTSFATEWWVEQVSKRLPDWQLVKYSAPGWAGNHDAVTLRRL